MRQQDLHNLKEFLDEQTARFNVHSFIDSDPICVPHRFSKKEDREISGFLTATLAWGQRPIILRNASLLMEWMDHAPADFILNHSPSERRPFKKFVHRTFNGEDAVYFLKALQQLYKNHGGLENTFQNALKSSSGTGEAIHKWRKLFLSFNSPTRTAKHFADPLANSSAKRLCMFLRWMVRKDANQVDFGIWKKISAASLYAPLDLHSGKTARELGLLQRKQDDWKAVEELTAMLRLFDPEDPVKYDYALYGAGIAERYKLTDF
jgi:uncharacterized protein (TIGR02757 family)